MYIKFRRFFCDLEYVLVQTLLLQTLFLQTLFQRAVLYQKEGYLIVYPVI